MSDYKLCKECYPYPLTLMHGNLVYETCKEHRYLKLEADNAALREQVKRLSTCGTDHSTPWWQVKCEDLEAQLATLQAQLADRDAMILQMGKQAAGLAKDGIAAKAQLRQVEGELAAMKGATNASS